MSAADAINAGIGPKLFLVARMAFLVLLCTWFLRRNGERWADFGLRRPRRWWMVPLLAAGGFLLLIMVSMFMMHLLLPAIGAKDPEVGRTPAMRADLGEYLFWAIPVSWGSAAFGEELLARGFILNRIGQVIGSSRTPAIFAAVVLQAVIFGLFHIHQGIGGVLMTGAAGLIIGLIWLVGGRNLWPCFLLHGLIDFLAANGL
jgi:membrane protease YdiL (CAAX protease family)